MLEEMSLMDFLDEEVVDKEGVPVGTLGCFWEAAPNVAAFYGVKLPRFSVVRVVPMRGSVRDERHSCIRLGFDAQQVETAPGWDCSMELDAFLQEKVNAHFGLVGVELHTGLKYFVQKTSAASGDGTCGKGGAK